MRPWTQCLRSLSASKGLCHMDWAFTETQWCGPYSQHGRVGNQILIFWYSIQYYPQNTIAEFIWPFPSVSPSSQSGRWVVPSGCTVLNRVERNFSPKLGPHTKPASYATAALIACPLPDAAREKGLYWVFQQLVPHLGTAQEYRLCTPVRWCLAPSPWFPSSCIICLILAFLSSFPSPSPTSMHTACFRTPSLCPPLLLMFDKRKCVMPDKHIPVPNCLGLF